MIPNTLSSGLDDYPRATVPTADEFHVDLHSWMTKSAGVMAKLQTLLLRSNESSSDSAAYSFDYAGLRSTLQSGLEDFHWSEQHRGYFDVGMNNESSFFLVEVFFRCSSAASAAAATVQDAAVDIAVPVDYLQSGKAFCPPSHPTVLFPHGDGMGNYKQRERLVQRYFPASSSLKSLFF